MKSKTIELPIAEFNKLIKRIDWYKDRVSDLEKTVDYLNNEISTYNVKFAKESK